jgi:hypothetical protein
LTRLRVILISEYPKKSGAPTGALASDFETFVSQYDQISFRFLTINRKYRPNGLRPGRIWNLCYLHALVWLILPIERVVAAWNKQKICCLVTTSPPLIQWSVALVGFLFQIPSTIWYLDAHPEIEARSLEKRRFHFIAAALRYLDRLFSSLCSGFIALDEAMRKDFLKRTNFSKNSEVIPPWSTYREPGKPLRIPASDKGLRLLYAGNYGKVHDLSPLVAAIRRVDVMQQQRLSCTFIGMSPESQDQLRSIFSRSHIRLEFRPRVDSIDELLETFDSHDFGIVSLAESSKGVACPSKALTYLSQGLPILYVGPAETMSYYIVQDGWGVLPEYIIGMDSWPWPYGLEKNGGKIFANPQPESQERMLKQILNTVYQDLVPRVQLSKNRHRFEAEP